MSLPYRLSLVAACSVAVLLPSACDGVRSRLHAEGDESPSSDGGGTTNAGMADAGTNDGGAAERPDGSVPGALDASVPALVEKWISGRSRLGARSTAGYRAWRGGLAVRGGRLYWVESGAMPGLYSAPTSGCAEDGGCVEPVAAFTRPSVFAATADDLFAADVTVLKRFPLDGGSPQSVASSASEIVNLAATPASAFWTAGTAANIYGTPAGGTTNTLIYSNGTPIAMALAGDRVFWAGVDISGQLGALQSIGTNGTGAREVSRFSSGLQAMGGTAQYLYYAKDSPAVVHRLTVSTGRVEVLERDTLGVCDFAFDDTYAYWVEPGDAPDYLNGRVRRVAHDSQTAQTLAVSVRRPVAIAVSGRTVYVASAGTPASSYADGAILRLTLTD